MHFLTRTVLKHLTAAYTIIKIKQPNPTRNSLLILPVVDAFMINCNTKAIPISKQEEQK